MVNINYMYHIYEGFEKEIDVIFKSSIEKYNLKIIKPSDYGAILENQHFGIDISYETGLQYWCSDIKSNQKFLLCEALRLKQIDYHGLRLFLGDSKKEKLLKINEILVKNFEEEFSGKYEYRDYVIKLSRLKNLFLQLEHKIEDDEKRKALENSMFNESERFISEFTQFLKDKNMLPADLDNN